MHCNPREYVQLRLQPYPRTLIRSPTGCHPLPDICNRFLGLRPILHEEPLDRRYRKGISGDLLCEPICQGMFRFCAVSRGVEVCEEIANLDGDQRDSWIAGVRTCIAVAFLNSIHTSIRPKDGSDRIGKGCYSRTRSLQCRVEAVDMISA